MQLITQDTAFIQDQLNTIDLLSKTALNKGAGLEERLMAKEGLDVAIRSLIKTTPLPFNTQMVLSHYHQQVSNESFINNSIKLIEQFVTYVAELVKKIMEYLLKTFLTVKNQIINLLTINKVDRLEKLYNVFKKQYAIAQNPKSSAVNKRIEPEIHYYIPDKILNSHSYLITYNKVKKCHELNKDLPITELGVYKDIAVIMALHQGTVRMLTELLVAIILLLNDVLTDEVSRRRLLSIQKLSLFKDQKWIKDIGVANTGKLFLKMLKINAATITSYSDPIIEQAYLEYYRGLCRGFILPTFGKLGVVSKSNKGDYVGIINLYSHQWIYNEYDLSPNGSRSIFTISNHASRVEQSTNRAPFILSSADEIDPYLYPAAKVFSAESVTNINLYKTVIESLIKTMVKGKADLSITYYDSSYNSIPNDKELTEGLKEVINLISPITSPGGPDVQTVEDKQGLINLLTLVEKQLINVSGLQTNLAMDLIKFQASCYNLCLYLLMAPPDEQGRVGKYVS